MVEAYLACLDLGYYEAKVVFEGLADEHVWKRPTEGLLSVGELAGHISFWEAVKFAGEGGEPEPDPAKCRVSSPLIDPQFQYYPKTLAIPPSDQVCGELLRVHEEAIAHFRALNPDLESSPPGWPSWYGSTYGEFLKYAVFHVSYHVGQMYSVRHLLGEETPDN
jgi:DinB family protein